MKKLLIITFIIIFLYSGNIFADGTIAFNKIITIYAQSEKESEAHMIGIEGMYSDGDHPQCIDRAYIEFSDKELFATALIASILGKKVHIDYIDNAEPKLIMGHTDGLTCKVISIFW